jgi:hypothetical protein
MEDQELDLFQEDPTLAPDQALMQPIDQVVGENPELLSVGTPEDMLPAPVMSPVNPAARLDSVSTGSVIKDTLLGPNVIEEGMNAIGAQYPIDPYTGQPRPEAAASPAASVMSPAVLAPEQQTIQQKTGDTSRAVVEPTAGTVSALQGARQAVTAQDTALRAEAEIAGALAKDKMSIDQLRAAAASEYAIQAESLSREAERQAAINRDEIARLRQEYASQPWQSYWGSKDTGDKIMLGLAVGLGALGQAKIGGQNLAMAFIQSGIDDHNKSQTERFRMLEAQLNSAQTNNVQAQQALKGQFDNLIASRAAAYDQLDKQLAAMSAKTNVQGAQVAIEKLRAESSLKANKELFEMENELSARTTNRTDVFSTKTVKGNPLSFVRADGQPMTEAQSKEYKMFLNVAPALKDIEALEDQGLTNTAGYANVKKALLGESRDLGGFKGLMEGALLIAKFDSAVDRATAGDPGLQLYMRAQRKVMIDKLRLDSGASIAPSEYLSFVQTYLPSDLTMNMSPENQKINLDQARKYRRSFLESALGASGSASQPWYKEGQK